MKTAEQNGRSPLVFGDVHSEFRDAIILGQGLPNEINGQPVRYMWKEALPPKKFIDSGGVVHNIEPARINAIIADNKRAFAKGYRPPILLGHSRRGEAKDPSKSRGFIVDVRKNEAGSLDLLHQLIGDESIRDAARNKTSICIYPDRTDEDGEHYDQLIDHQALVPDPQLNLTDFQPALAASRGESQQPAIFLELAASNPQEPEMDLSKLRDALGAAKEMPDTDLLTLAITKLGEAKPALELSRTAPTTIATLTQERDAANAKVLELSKAAPVPDVGLMNGFATLATGQIDLCLSQGKCTKAQADLVKTMLRDGDAPAVLMLSKTGANGSPVDAILKVLELNKAMTGVVTGGQPLPDPNDPMPKPLTPERKAQLLSMA